MSSTQLIWKFIISCTVFLAMAPPALAQAVTIGSLEGVVRDAQGFVLPGAAVSVWGPVIVGHRAAVTDVDGAYRFPALPPGSYTATCELLGFQRLQREGIVITAGRSFGLDFTLEPSGPEEGAPEPSVAPIIDAKAAGAAAKFETNELHDVPSATDLWAVLQQSPGVWMRGFDVGGSHKAQQTEYETFGIRSQNRIVNDGVNTTEGTGDAGGFYDYYAVAEFQVSGQGLDVEMSTPGAQVVATWKSGTNRFSGLYHGDFETEDFVSNNLDEDLESRAGTPARLRTFYEYHADLGGPIVKDRAWFYVAHNRFFIDRAVSGQDPSVATDVSDLDMFTGKVNVRLTDRDQLNAFGHWSFHQQPHRGLSLTVPPDSVLAQESWSSFYKAEWQRSWSDRLSSTIMVGNFGLDWQSVPTVDPVTNPPRLDTATGFRSGAGWQPFHLLRSKPQSTGQLNYFLETGLAGSHDVKLGWDWQLDRNGRAWTSASGAILYLDNSAFGLPTSDENVFVDRIQFTNAPNAGETDHNQHTDFFAQDTWSVNDRLTVSLGVRFGRQRLYHTDIENDPIQTDIFQPTRSARTDFVEWWSTAPRLGATVDLSGKGKTFFKAFLGKFYANAGSGLPEANPGGRGLRTYAFADPNGNGIYDGTHELGDLLEATGGGATAVDPGLELAYTDEISLSGEHELAPDFGVRFSYVRKRHRNLWGHDVNVAQALNLSSEIDALCTGCPLGLEESVINLVTIPDDQAELVDTRILNAPLLFTTGGENTDMTFTTWQLAIHRRFRDNFLLRASFDKHFRDELRSAESSESPYVTDPIEQGWFQNHSLDVTNRQETKAWSVKALARYVMGSEFGVALGVRVQSGFPWAPIHRLQVPNVGTKAILLLDLEENRSDDVALVDFRLDKTWTIQDRYRLTMLADVYNLLDANTETNFILRTGSRFNDVIEWLPGRTLKLGLRFQF